MIQVVEYHFEVIIIGNLLLDQLKMRLYNVNKAMI